MTKRQQAMSRRSSVRHRQRRLLGVHVSGRMLGAGSASSCSSCCCTCSSCGCKLQCGSRARGDALGACLLLQGGAAGL
jgi:hypothetical protein